MIKNLLNADEEPPEGTQVIIEEKLVSPPETQFSEPVNVTEMPVITESRPTFEIPEDAKFFTPPTQSTAQSPQSSETAAPDFEDAKAEDLPFEEKIIDEKVTAEPPEILAVNDFKPPSKADTIRQSGMAYSAAIVFFGSIVFMMILGWLADWLLGSNPWGIVGGIILGGVIGFVQFYRITSQIFKDQG